MQWKSDSQTSSPPEFFFADAPSGGRDAWLREMWEFFGKTVVPLNTTVGWDYVYVKVAAEVGRILVYPASSATPNRVEKAGCCVPSADLQSKYEALEALDEDAFEAGLTTEVEQLAKEILASSVALSACSEELPPEGSEMRWLGGSRVVVGVAFGPGRTRVARFRFSSRASPRSSIDPADSRSRTPPGRL